MKYSKFFFAAGLLALATACTNETEELENSAKLPVRLSYTTLQAIDTRASASQTLNQDYIESGKEVRVSIAPINNPTAYEHYVFTTGANGVLNIPTENPPYYPLNGTHIGIYAGYPAASVASGSHSVLADQSSDDNYAASDLMLATPVDDQAKTADAVTLTFAHKMAKVKVDVTPGTAVKQINWIKLKSVQPTVTVNHITGTVGAATGEAADIIIAKEEATDGKKIQGAAVFPAQTLSGALLEIGVTMADNSTGTATYTVVSKAFAANNVYTLDITVNGPEVNASTAITNWAANGSVTINPTQVLTFNVGGAIFNMISVKGGDYTTLGGVDVTGSLSDYYIGQTEVTQALWKAVMGTLPQSMSGGGDLFPVNKVTWEDICTASTGFLALLNAAVADQKPAGMNFKLPTEAQWEYAARGGVNKSNYTYAGSNTIGDVAWYLGNSENSAHPVGLKTPNALGLYDMSGNVWEWCADKWKDIEDGENLGLDYAGPKESEYEEDGTGRGGSWIYDETNQEVSARFHYQKTLCSDKVGFRLVLQ